MRGAGRWLVCGALVASLAGLVPGPGVILPVASAHAQSVADVPLPRGGHALGDGLYASGLGFRQTVTFYERFLDRNGVAHQAIPVYAYRGAVVARFLSRQPATSWLAIHVVRAQGRTTIFIVHKPLDEPNTPG